MKSKTNKKTNKKNNRKTNKKVNKFKTHKKRNLNHKGGCDVPGFPDGNDVWERRNGIRSGTFFSILQFYKFIDWITCNKMYKFGLKIFKKKESLSVLKNDIESNLNSALKDFVIYDTTGQIQTTEEIPSPSFVFGNAIINLEERKVFFYQSQKDQYGNTKLSFEFPYSSEINVIINKKTEKNEKQEIFIFPEEDAKFKLGFKNLKMPSTNIKDIMKSMRESRITMLDMQKSLTRNQLKEQRIQSGNQSSQNIQANKVAFL